jgi:hypothetical protein
VACVGRWKTTKSHGILDLSIAVAKPAFGALAIPAGATTTQTGPPMTTPGVRGVKVCLDVTNAGTGSITLTIQGRDPASGKYFTILAGNAVTANGTNVYSVFPGAVGSANAVADDGLPEQWRLLVTANNANPMTYTVGFSTLA